MAAFKRGDRVRLVARNPNPPPNRELGRLGTFDRKLSLDEAFTVARNTTHKAKRCWVIWDSPMEVVGRRFVRRTIVSLHHLEHWLQPDPWWKRLLRWRRKGPWGAFVIKHPDGRKTIIP